jgi:alanine racemase
MHLCQDNMQTQKNVAVLSRYALENNVARLRELAPNSKLMAMVKANAYGHGMLGVCEVIAPLVDGLAVATIEEACLLRQAHPNIPTILVMEGVLYLDEVYLAVQHNLTLVLHHEHELDLIEQYARQHTLLTPLPVWIQIDTGMHRLGFLPASLPVLFSAVQEFQESGWIEVKCWMTHFSASEDLLDPANQHQLSQYAEHVAELPGEKSMANSAAILQIPQSHQDWIRPGLLLYGASPIENIDATTLGFQPVMSLTSPILAIRTIPEGSRIGYNGIWRAKRESIIATIGIGYGDGYPRHIKPNTPVWINYQRFPIVGRVSMDMMMVDITDELIDQAIPSIAVGTRAELWGYNISIEELAKQANTIPYELFCQLTNRIHFSWEA